MGLYFHFLAPLELNVELEPFVKKLNTTVTCRFILMNSIQEQWSLKKYISLGESGNPPKARALVLYNSAWIRIKSLPWERSGSGVGVLLFRTTGFVSRDISMESFDHPQHAQSAECRAWETHHVSDRNYLTMALWHLQADHHHFLTHLHTSAYSSGCLWTQTRMKVDTTYQSSASPLHPPPCHNHRSAWTKSSFCSTCEVRALPWAWSWHILLSPHVWEHTEGSTESGQWLSLPTIVSPY